MERTNLLGASLADIKSLLGEAAERPYRARQVYAGIYARRLTDWAAFTDLPGPLRSRLGERFRIAYPKPGAVFVSRDGTRRYLLELEGGHKIESVFIPEPRRDTICISTQVGCAVGCLFCVTGKLPMRHNLSAGEIVGQVLALLAERGILSKRLNVVIMGMGEPLHNYEQVMAAISLMTDSEGMAISPRRITLSTSGVVPQLERLASEDVIPNLAVTLSATTDAVRNLLIPINRKWNISSLLGACRKFPLDRRRRITIEYVLIEGINDTPEDARRLVRLLRGLRTKVNLIPLNADPWVPLKKPGEERVLSFQRILIDGHVTAYIRRPRGDDVSAACGMLAGRDYARGDHEHAPPKPVRPSTLTRLESL